MNPRDVLIIGGGPAGLAMAVSLVQQGFTVSLVEQLHESVLADPPPDGRDIALTFRSRDILQSLGIWARLPAEEVALIRGAQVEQEDSPHFLSLFARPDAARPQENLGFLVPNHCIRKAAYEAAKGLAGRDLELICGAQVAGLVTNEREARITLKDGRTLEGSLLIAADSRFSAARRQMGIAAHMHDFGREVIVCRMAHEAQGDGVAHECFHWGRTLAILPMNKKEVSVVMTVKTPDAQALADLSAEALAREVEAQFGGRLGAMRLVGARHRYPLVAVYARRFVARRFALIGDAAVGMHPVTAHGYNFGLYGVECLTRQMRDAREAGRDFAGEAVLAAYQRAHRRETFAIFAGTNALVKLFTDERRIARVVRPRLLKLANRLPPLKAWITRHLTDVPGPRGPGRLIAQLKSLRG